jgi:hypothetical protein
MKKVKHIQLKEEVKIHETVFCKREKREKYIKTKNGNMKSGGKLKKRHVKLGS